MSIIFQQNWKEIRNQNSSFVMILKSGHFNLNFSFFKLKASQYKGLTLLFRKQRISGHSGATTGKATAVGL